MTDHDMARALTLSSRWYPLLSVPVLGSMIGLLMAISYARRIERLMDRLKELS